MMVKRIGVGGWVMCVYVSVYRERDERISRECSVDPTYLKSIRSFMLGINA